MAAPTLSRPDREALAAENAALRQRIDRLARRVARVEAERGRATWRAFGPECLIIGLAVLAYCSKFLDLGTWRPLSGLEGPLFQVLDWLLVTSLERYAELPLWNPYIRTGYPLMADPFLHLYNPLATGPVLLFGVMDGFKIGLLLSFFAAALGAWWLGALLGVGRAGRLWMALMYAFTGQAAAKFIQGHYDFVLGFAWIPWSVAALIAATRSHRRLHIAAAAISLSLIFFSGNLYYAFYALQMAMLYALTVLVTPRTTHPLVRFDLPTAKTLATIGLLVLGLTAVQALPLFELRSHIGHPNDPEFKQSHNLGQIWLDYVSTDPRRPDAIDLVPPEEFYAYTGVWPFLALALLPLVRLRQQRRPVLFFILFLVVIVLWVDIRDMPWREVYASGPLVSQFRYPTRLLLFGACALIALAGLSLDAGWRLALSQARRPGGSSIGVLRSVAAHLGLALLAGFMMFAVIDVYGQNRRLIGTREAWEPPFTVASWLRAYDPGIYYVDAPGEWYVALLTHELRYLNGAYYQFIADERARVNERRVVARPKYLVGGRDPPPLPEPRLLRDFGQYRLYHLPRSLPYVFSVRREVLSGRAGDRELERSEVTEWLPMVRPNSVAVTAEGEGEGEADSLLVVMMSTYTGWQVRVDGVEQPLRNVGGYLATELQPGAHAYVFEYNPLTWKVGLGISALTLAVILAMLGSELPIRRPGSRWPGSRSFGGG